MLLIQPKVLIVPPALEAVAHELLESRYIKHIGNYTLYEYKGRQKWSRNFYTESGRWSFPRWDESPNPIAHINRHMRKRGFPSLMTEPEMYDAFGSCLGC